MKNIITVCLFTILWLHGNANNVNLSNIQVVNNGPGNTYIQFDLSWDNSWRVKNGPANFDGVWVFFKYKSNHPNALYWSHVQLHPDVGPDFFPEGLDAWQDPANLGAILYRSGSNEGTGPVSFTGIRLGLYPHVLPLDVDIKGFAVEMVYIPTHGHPLYTPSWFVGDGDGTSESTNAFHIFDNPNRASYAGGETTVTPNIHDDYIIEEPNYFILAGPGSDGIEVPYGINNPYYPTGSAFWCMKYEVSQGAYRDFLNTIVLSQQIGRTATSPTSSIGTGALVAGGANRNWLEIKTSSVDGQAAEYGCDANGNNVFDEPGDGEYVACNYLSWPDLAAWLSWAGMCPMTEIQFERICRGAKYSEFPVTKGEYAWGDTTRFLGSLTLANASGPNEIISNASNSLGNAACEGSGLNGPLRNGIFATGSSNRATSGAAFYGVMEMSGNVFEVCVTMGNTAGRSFNKYAQYGLYGSSRGNGYVDVNGNAYAYAWPGCTGASHASELSDDCTVTNAIGTILRGGSWDLSPLYLRTSDRGGDEAFDFRTQLQGGRGVIVPAMFEN